MAFSQRLAGLAAGLAIGAIIGGTAPAQASGTGQSPGGSYTLPTGIIDPCPPVSPGLAGCAARISAPSAASAQSEAKASAAAVTPSGYAPTDLRQAYGLQSGTEGSGQTVAVVTPYDDPDAASDLAAYRGQYGLSPCTAADGCLAQVSQAGTSSLPATDAGWSSPVSESIDMISAICANCRIIIVEASTSAITDLGTAENEAVSLGAKFIVNDWYIPEADLSASDETADDSDYFNHPGVVITAPGGDDGYDQSYPAASPDVIAVGGTTLTADSSTPRGFTETAWAGSNSGCSAYELKPAWQTDSGCSTRTLNDLSAVADPNTPVAYYDTPTTGGWGEGGGTVAAAAIVAASYALAGTPGSSDYPAKYPYEHPGGTYTTPGNAYTSPVGLNNITSGSNGTCSVSYLCTAGAGYNGPGGLGSPSGTVSLTANGGQTGVIHGALADICVDDSHGGLATGTVIDGDDCNGTSSQQWTIEPDGTIQFGTASGYCLYIANAATASGSLAELASCSAADLAMNWIPEYNGELYNPRSGKCLYDPDGTTYGTQLEINTCGVSRTVTWYTPYTQPAASGPVKSQLTTASLCMDDANSGTTNGNKIQVYNCLGDAAQNWAVHGDGTIQIFGGCLTPGSPLAAGAKITWSACTGAEDQDWIIHSDGSIQSYSYNIYLTDPSASTTNGTQLDIEADTGAAQQLWNVP